MGLSDRRPGQLSWINALLVLCSHLDSTQKVSDVLKLFEDGEMAKYLQGDVSGSWEVLSLTNSAHLCFCYSIGVPIFQG